MEEKVQVEGMARSTGRKSCEAGNKNAEAKEGMRRRKRQMSLGHWTEPRGAPFQP